MKIGKSFLLFLLVLSSSCKTPSSYFGRRTDIKPAINSNCTAFRDGEIIDATNYISISTDDYDYLMRYFEDKEFRLYKCLKFGRCL